MFLADAFAILIVLFFVSILFSFFVLSLMEAFCGLYGALSYPFNLLRRKLAGAEEDKAPLPRLLLSVLVSKLLAATIVGAIALYLGATVKATAIAAAAAFVFLG